MKKLLLVVTVLIGLTCASYAANEKCKPHKVPDMGSTALLLGAGMTGIVLFRKK